MINYFKNKKTGGLIALDSNTNEITEFDLIIPSESSGGGR